MARVTIESDKNNNIVQLLDFKEDKLTGEIVIERKESLPITFDDLTATDGHSVKSLGEKIVDDMLYNNRIVHAYSHTVSEIDITEEQSVEADWFIPVLSSAKGIYIEYWGMTTKSYLENKQRKIDQYKKHNIPVIEIQEEEPFENSDILRVRIMRELKTLSKEHYKYDWSV